MPVSEDQIRAAIARRQQAQQQVTGGQVAQPQTPAAVQTSQGVTDQQIQAAIARRQQAQQAQQSQPNLGGIESTIVSPEQIQQDKLNEIQVASNKSQQARDITANQFLSGNADIKDMGVFDLMESVNKAKTFKDFKQRTVAVDELRRRGIPRDVIETFTKLDDPTGFMQSLKDEAFVGGTAAVASGITGAVTKSPRAAAAAAAIAGGVAEVGEEAFNRVFRSERARGGLELGTDVAKTAAVEGVGDIVGGKVFSAIGGGIKMGANKLFVGNRVIEGAEEMSKELARVGKTIKPEDIPQFLGQKLPDIAGGLDPAQKSSSKLTAWFMGSLERAFGGGRLLERKETVNPVILKKIISQDMDSLMGDIAKLAPTQIGALADDAFSGSQKAFRAIDSYNFTAFKEAVDAGTGKKPVVSMKNNRSMAQRLLKQVEEGKLLSGFDEDKQFIKNMSNIADGTNIEQAITNRSNLNAMAEQLPKGSNARRLANQMKAELKTQMMKTANGVSSKAGKLGDEAYKYSTKARKLYNSKILELVAQDVADGIPQSASARIFQPEGVTRINQVKDVLLSREGKSPIDIQKHKAAWDELRWGWMRDELKQASTVDDIPIMGEKMAGRFKEMGDAIPAMFSSKERSALNNSINKMRFVERQATGGSAELARFVQVGAAAGGRFGGKPGLMMAALGGPAAMARAMANKNAGSMFLGGKTGQFMALMAKANQELKKERKKIKEFEAKAIRNKAIQLGARDE